MSRPLTTKQQHWSEILEAAEKSGLPLIEFARQNQLAAQDLYRWRNQLKRPTKVTAQTKVQFSQVVATSFSAAPSVSIKLPQAQLDFASLPDPDWLARFIAYQSLPA